MTAESADSASPEGGFPSTHWSMVEKARLAGNADKRAAMDRFISTYWRPVYYFIRARGIPSAKAEDLTQDFLLKLMERDWLARADRQRGRFRNFILRVLSRFLADQGPKRANRQHQFEQSLLPIAMQVTDEDRAFEPAEGTDAGELFLRMWAKELVRSACEAVRASCEADGKHAWYEVFAAIYLAPPGAPDLTQSELAERLELTHDQVRYAQVQSTRRFLELLRMELRGQAGAQDDLDDEVLSVLQLARLA